MATTENTQLNLLFKNLVNKNFTRYTAKISQEDNINKYINNNNIFSDPIPDTSFNITSYQNYNYNSIDISRAQIIDFSYIYHYKRIKLTFIPGSITDYDSLLQTSIGGSWQISNDISFINLEKILLNDIFTYSIDLSINGVTTNNIGPTNGTYVPVIAGKSLIFFGNNTTNISKKITETTDVYLSCYIYDGSMGLTNIYNDISNISNFIDDLSINGVTINMLENSLNNYILGASFEDYILDISLLNLDISNIGRIYNNSSYITISSEDFYILNNKQIRQYVSGEIKLINERINNILGDNDDGSPSDSRIVYKNTDTSLNSLDISNVLQLTNIYNETTVLNVKQGKSVLQNLSAGLTDISDNLTVHGSTYINEDLMVDGSSNIKNNLIVDGNTTLQYLHVQNGLKVDGSKTLIYTDSKIISDPIITIGSISGENLLTETDNNDRGIDFNYFDGSNSNGFFGMITSNNHANFLSSDYTLSLYDFILAKNIDICHNTNDLSLSNISYGNLHLNDLYIYNSAGLLNIYDYNTISGIPYYLLNNRQIREYVSGEISYIKEILSGDSNDPDNISVVFQNNDASLNNLDISNIGQLINDTSYETISGEDFRYYILNNKQIRQYVSGEISIINNRINAITGDTTDSNPENLRIVYKNSDTSLNNLEISNNLYIQNEIYTYNDLSINYDNMNDYSHNIPNIGQISNILRTFAGPGTLLNIPKIFNFIQCNYKGILHNFNNANDFNQYIHLSNLDLQFQPSYIGNSIIYYADINYLLKNIDATNINYISFKLVKEVNSISNELFIDNSINISTLSTNLRNEYQIYFIDNIDSTSITTYKIYVKIESQDLTSAVSLNMNLHNGSIIAKEINNNRFLSNIYTNFINDSLLGQTIDNYFDNSYVLTFNPLENDSYFFLYCKIKYQINGNYFINIIIEVSDDNKITYNQVYNNKIGTANSSSLTDIFSTLFIYKNNDFNQKYFRIGFELIPSPGTTSSSIPHSGFIADSNNLIFGYEVFNTIDDNIFENLIISESSSNSYIINSLNQPTIISDISITPLENIESIILNYDLNYKVTNCFINFYLIKYYDDISVVLHSDLSLGILSSTDQLFNNYTLKYIDTNNIKEDLSINYKLKFELTDNGSASTPINSGVSGEVLSYIYQAYEDLHVFGTLARTINLVEGSNILITQNDNNSTISLSNSIEVSNITLNSSQTYNEISDNSFVVLNNLQIKDLINDKIANNPGVGGGGGGSGSSDNFFFFFQSKPYPLTYIDGSYNYPITSKGINYRFMDISYDFSYNYGNITDSSINNLLTNNKQQLQLKFKIPPRIFIDWNYNTLTSNQLNYIPFYEQLVVEFRDASNIDNIPPSSDSSWSLWRNLNTYDLSNLDPSSNPSYINDLCYNYILDISKVENTPPPIQNTHTIEDDTSTIRLMYYYNLDENIIQISKFYQFRLYLKNSSNFDLSLIPGLASYNQFEQSIYSNEISYNYLYFPDTSNNTFATLSRGTPIAPDSLFFYHTSPEVNNFFYFSISGSFPLYNNTSLDSNGVVRNPATNENNYLKFFIDLSAEKLTNYKKAIEPDSGFDLTVNRITSHNVSANSFVLNNLDSSVNNYQPEFNYDVSSYGVYFNNKPTDASYADRDNLIGDNSFNISIPTRNQINSQFNDKIDSVFSSNNYNIFNMQKENDKYSLNKTSDNINTDICFINVKIRSDGNNKYINFFTEASSNIILSNDESYNLFNSKNSTYENQSVGKELLHGNLCSFKFKLDKINSTNGDTTSVYDISFDTSSNNFSYYKIMQQDSCLNVVIETFDICNSQGIIPEGSNNNYSRNNGYYIGSILSDLSIACDLNSFFDVHTDLSKTNINLNFAIDQSFNDQILGISNDFPIYKITDELTKNFTIDTSNLTIINDISVEHLGTYFGITSVRPYDDIQQSSIQVDFSATINDLNKYIKSITNNNIAKTDISVINLSNDSTNDLGNIFNPVASKFYSWPSNQNTFSNISDTFFTNPYNIHVSNNNEYGFITQDISLIGSVKLTLYNNLFSNGETSETFTTPIDQSIELSANYFWDETTIPSLTHNPSMIRFINNPLENDSTTIFNYENFYDSSLIYYNQILFQNNNLYSANFSNIYKDYSSYQENSNINYDSFDNSGDILPSIYSQFTQWFYNTQQITIPSDINNIYKWICFKYTNLPTLTSGNIKLKLENTNINDLQNFNYLFFIKVKYSTTSNFSIWYNCQRRQTSSDGGSAKGIYSNQVAQRYPLELVIPYFNQISELYLLIGIKNNINLTISSNFINLEFNANF